MAHSFLGLNGARFGVITFVLMVLAFVEKRMFSVNPDTWIVSDTHFGHKNIVKYCNRPEDHNTLMVSRWNHLVGDTDDVLHLGDLAVWYGPEEKMWQDVAARLPGNKYMLRGNHDKRKDREYAAIGFTVIPEFIQEINGQRVLFSHYPDEARTHEATGYQQWDINIHGHIHNNDLEPRLASTGRRYKNVSIEVMDYQPVRLSAILGL